MKGKVFVIDTNVLIDYVDIIPDLKNPEHDFSEATIDFTGSCVAIPIKVTSELAKFKDDDGDTHRKRAASELLGRIREIFDCDPPTIGESYEMASAAAKEIDGVTFMLLPVHKDFHKSLPIKVDEKNGDDAILMAALTVAFIKEGLRIDGTASRYDVENLRVRDVFLVTNDRQFSVSAWTGGIRALKYHHRQPEPYSGIREVVVPNDLLYRFLAAKKLTMEEWNYHMPGEPALISNEFIVMSLADKQDYPHNYRDADYSNVGRFDPKTRTIVSLKYAQHFPIRPKTFHQAVYLEALLHPDIDGVICSGPAGAGKTFLALAAGVSLVLNGKIRRIFIVPFKERESFGWLPGGMDNKMSPYIEAFKDAFRSLAECGGLTALEDTYATTPREIKKPRKKSQAQPDESNGGIPSATAIDDMAESAWKEYCSTISVKFADGRNLSNCLLVCDEFQLQNVSNAKLLINRLGNGSKLVVAGDLAQSNQQYATVWDNGMTYAMDVMYNLDCVARVYLTGDDNGRSRLVKAIAKRLEERKRPRDKSKTGAKPANESIS